MRWKSVFFPYICDVNKIYGTKSSSKTRIEVVDALRGFAVTAIILVHNLEHFISLFIRQIHRSGWRFWTKEF